MLVEEGTGKAWSVCTLIKVKRKGHPSPPNFEEGRMGRERWSLRDELRNSAIMKKHMNLRGLKCAG